MTITLATLPNATAQEVFDQVVTHLRKQGAKSLSGDGETNYAGGPLCLYRGAGGMKCAAGCLISDDEYDQATYEGVDWPSLADVGTVPETHCGLISELQSIHDSDSVARWEREFAELANRCGLIYTPPTPKA